MNFQNRQAKVHQSSFLSFSSINDVFMIALMTLIQSVVR